MRLLGIVTQRADALIGHPFRLMITSPVIQTLADLVRIDSVNTAYGGPGEREIATWVRSFFEQREIEVWEQEVFPRPAL